MKIVGAADFVGGFWALKWAWKTFFGSIDRYWWIYFSWNVYSSIKTVGATVLGVLWAWEWEWLIAETNLRCARSSGTCMPNPNSLALIVSEISAFIRTDGQKASSTRLVILIKNIYTIYMGSETLPSVCYILSDESSIPFSSTSNGYKNMLSISNMIMFFRLYYYV